MKYNNVCSACKITWVSDEVPNFCPECGAEILVSCAQIKPPDDDSIPEDSLIESIAKLRDEIWDDVEGITNSGAMIGSPEEVVLAAISVIKKLKGE